MLQEVVYNRFKFVHDTNLDRFNTHRSRNKYVTSTPLVCPMFLIMSSLMLQQPSYTRFARASIDPFSRTRFSRNDLPFKWRSSYGRLIHVYSIQRGTFDFGGFSEKEYYLTCRIHLRVTINPFSRCVCALATVWQVTLMRHKNRCLLVGEPIFMPGFYEFVPFFCMWYWRTYVASCC